MSRGARAALVAPSSFDEASRTFEFVGTTERPCVMTYWRESADGWMEPFEVLETLTMAGCVLPDVSGRKLPLLDAHQRWEQRNQVGSVTDLWVEGDQLMGAGALSRRADVEWLVQDVQDGHATNISAGYEVLEYELKTIDGVLNSIVTRWTPFEMSFVPVGADPHAQTRAMRAHRGRRQAPARSKPRTRTHRGSRAMLEELQALQDAIARLIAAAELIDASTDDVPEDAADESVSVVSELAVEIDTMAADIEAMNDEVAEVAAAEPVAVAAAARGRRGRRAAPSTKSSVRNARQPKAPVGRRAAGSDAAAIRGLRASAIRNGIKAADFDAQTAAGATLAELRSFAAKGVAPAGQDIDTARRGGARAGAVKDPSEHTFADAAVGKRAAARRAGRAGAR